MKIIGVIPARYQSSRFPGKPLALINGKSMIWWVYNQAKKVKAFDELYVATDSELIKEECIKNGIQVIMTKDSHPTGTDRLGEVALMKEDADFFVNIQGDEPLIEPEVIETIINYKKEHPEIHVINTMCQLKKNIDVTAPSIVKVAAAENNDLLYLSRSVIPCSKNGEKINYKKHLGLYGISREALLFYSSTNRGVIESIEDVEMLRFLENGYKIKILEVTSNSIGVDLPTDIKRVEEVLNNM